MTTNEITQALLLIDPDFHFGICGTDYSKIEWYDSKPKPTWEEVQAAWANR
jgi:hypothetical protein